MTTANFPLPVPNLDNQEFWDQCRQHRLVLRRCLDCRSFYHPPRPNCPGVRFVQPGVGGVAGEG